MQAQQGADAARDEENGKPLPDRRSFVDSAYRSLSSLSLSLTESAWSIAGRKPTVSPTIGLNLLHFDLDPRADELDHYNDIKPRIRARVAKIAKERHAKSCGIQAMVFGEVEAEAKLHVVVFCAPLLESAFNEMFASSPVHELLELPYPGRSLEFLVIPESPSPVAAYVDIDVCYQTGYASKHRTYCGAPAIFRARHKTGGYCDTFRQGTIGGIVQVSYSDGKTRLYGMTAGHVPSALQGEAQLRSADQDDAVRPDSTPNILEWISDDNVLGSLIRTPQLPEIMAGHAEATHDWALIDVTNPLPNRAIPMTSAKGLETARSHPILIAATPNAQAVIPDTVVLLGGTAGSRHGQFSKLPAEIWSEEGGCFVDVYVLALIDGKVSPGDSGAWIVHVANSELYGHVIATNALDQVYVVPVLDTFENMRACLGAVSVDLPNAEGLMKASSSSMPSELSSKSNGIYQKNIDLTRPTIHPLKGRKFQPRKAPGALKTTKRWDPVFRIDRRFFDQPFVESLMQQGIKLDTLGALLGDPSPEISRHEIERVGAYFRASQDRTSRPQARAWLIHDPINTRHAERVTAKTLSLSLLNSFASHQGHRSHCKAITLINPDSAYLLALIETVGWNEVRALRNVLVQYITSKTGIDIYIPTAGFVTFELSFHISYYTLRLSTKNDQSPRTIALLSTNLYEAQVSLTVVGISNNRWTSYCLVRVSDDDIDLTADEGSSDSGYGDEEWGWHECETPSEGISNTKTDDSSIKDPRKYWLESVRARMHSVVEEWRHIVCTLETIVQVQNIPALRIISEASLHLQKHLEQISELLCLFDKLKTHVASIIQAWSLFRSTKGSIAYLNDLDDEKTCATLGSIYALCDRLSSFQAELHRMEKTSKMMYKIVDRALARRISVESHELTRRTHEINLFSNSISQESAKLNRQNTAAAIETSRTTRVAVQLVLITTPLILALQYFGAEHQIFSFDRSPKAFVFGILILFCLLPVLTYGLGLIHQFWDGIHHKVFARSKKTTEFDEKCPPGWI